MKNNSDWVLIVDDNLDIAELTKEFLESEGYKVQIAGNGEEALSQLFKATSLPVILVTDYMMPKMNGFELSKIIQHDIRLRTVPVIITSGSFLIGQQANLGVAVLAKPFKVEHLLQKISEVLRVTRFTLK